MNLTSRLLEGLEKRVLSWNLSRDSHELDGSRPNFTSHEIGNFALISSDLDRHQGVEGEEATATACAANQDASSREVSQRVKA